MQAAPRMPGHGKENWKEDLGTAAKVERSNPKDYARAKKETEKEGKRIKAGGKRGDTERERERDNERGKRKRKRDRKRQRKRERGGGRE